MFHTLVVFQQPKIKTIKGFIVLKKVKDKIFGEMEYKHSWTKEESVIFFGKSYIINVTAQAYSTDTILESQQKNYANFRSYLEEHKNEIEEKLMEYCKTICDVTVTLDECMNPKTVIFERDGSWGILFDTDYDVENGIALFVINNQIKVDREDSFL